MRSLRQLEFSFEKFAIAVVNRHDAVAWEALQTPVRQEELEADLQQLRSRAIALEEEARELLRSLGAGRIATELRVEWNSRLKTAAGRADYREKLISLNPRLLQHPAEIDRTLRHELAHLLAQFRNARRHRNSPHGPEWRQACSDLGIPGEKRCHTLPFPAKRYARRFIYQCPNCRREFPRVHKIRRTVACRACCRVQNGGEFDVRFRLKLLAV